MQSDDTERRGWQIEKKLTIGDLVTVFVYLCALFLVWHNHDVRIVSLEIAKTAGETSDNRLEKKLDDLKGDISKSNDKLDKLINQHITGHFGIKDKS